MKFPESGSPFLFPCFYYRLFSTRQLYVHQIDPQGKLVLARWWNSKNQTFTAHCSVLISVKLGNHFWSLGYNWVLTRRIIYFGWIIHYTTTQQKIKFHSRSKLWNLVIFYFMKISVLQNHTFKRYRPTCSWRSTIYYLFETFDVK